MNLKNKIVQPCEQPLLHPCPRCKADEAKVVKALSGYLLHCPACRHVTAFGSSVDIVSADWNTQPPRGPYKKVS